MHKKSSKAVIRALAATHPNIDNTQLTKAVNDTDEIVNTLALTNHTVTKYLYLGYSQ